MKYSEYIMRNVRERLGLEPDDTSEDDRVEEMSSYEVIDHYLKWEGIIGYTHEIISLVTEVKGKETHYGTFI